MPKKKTQPKEQLTLIEVGPRNRQQIAPIARKYRQTVADRMELLSQEVKLKETIHGLIKKSGLKRLPNGHITFECEGLLIDVEPRDEVIHVTEKKEKKSRKAEK